MFKDNFGRLLQQRGISALKLAQDTGIPKSIVYEWRNGERLPSAENLSKLSRYFGVSLETLIGDGDDLLPSNATEQELIVLLRAAREVSGAEREQIIEKFQRSIKKYFDESDKIDKKPPAKRRRNKTDGPDQA